MLQEFSQLWLSEDENGLTSIDFSASNTLFVADNKGAVTMLDPRAAKSAPTVKQAHEYKIGFARG